MIHTIFHISGPTSPLSSPGRLEGDFGDAASLVGEEAMASGRAPAEAQRYTLRVHVAVSIKETPRFS